MLNAADHGLVRRDPAVPGLAVVLDPDAVLSLVGRRVDGPVVLGARATYVRYKPGTSCVVGYELSTATGAVFAYAKAHAPATAPKITKARQREVRDERWGVGVVTNDDGVLVAAAMSDRDLPALRSLGDPARRERLMRALLPGRPDLWAQRPRAIRHKPERRWLGLVEQRGQPVALIKAYRAADFEHSRSRLKLLAPPAGRPLGWSRRRAALASSWIEGTSLSDLLAAHAPADMAAVGHALAALHAGGPTQGLTSNGSRTVTANLAPAAEALAGLLPPLGSRARRLADIVGRTLAGGQRHHCVVHGDFSADQIIISDTGADLIDFDQAQVADPAADLASFNAELIRAEIEGRLGRGRAPMIFADLLDAYHRAGGPAIHDRLAVHHAGALLRLAVAPFRERHPDWPELCEALVHAAEQCLVIPAFSARRTR